MNYIVFVISLKTNHTGTWFVLVMLQKIHVSSTSQSRLTYFLVSLLSSLLQTFSTPRSRDAVVQWCLHMSTSHYYRCTETFFESFGNFLYVLNTMTRNCIHFLDYRPLRKYNKSKISTNVRYSRMSVILFMRNTISQKRRKHDKHPNEYSFLFTIL